MWKTMLKTLTTLLIGLLASAVFAQNPVQTIRGKVVDATSGQPLAGAYICLPGTEPLRGGTSDENGLYRLEEVMVGRYQMEISFLGYETILIPEILVESGKELLLDIEMEEVASDLEAITVVGQGSNASSLSPVSVRSITVEESLRFPATFNDPARVAMTYAGVVNDNDQANGMSIRGNSPNGVSWRLENAEIVNPNHLSNAGTFSDRIAQSGGGVNILSAQLLGTSYFFTGAFPAGYGNALSGVMDMRFRQGNDEQREFVMQAGLVGFEFSTEGPLFKETGATYLFNYRYSFVGLLTAMGADFGGESISFQDVAFNVAVPTKNQGLFKVFGMAGNSKNLFETERDTAQWEIEKDRYDIDFESRMGAVGASYVMPVGGKGIWKTTLVASAVESKREASMLNENLEPISVDLDSLLNRKISIGTSLTFKVAKGQQLKVGLSAMEQFYNQHSIINGFTRNAGKGSGWLLQPYGQWIWTPNSQIKTTIGLHYSRFGYNDSESVEPRFSFQYLLDAKNKLSLAYGLHSQLQLPQVYFSTINSIEENKNLGLTKAQHAVLGYSYQLNSKTQIKTELYYQHLSDVPVSAVANNSFSTLNLLEGFASEALKNKGTGRNYGIELGVQRYITDDYFFLVNGTYYDSKYKGSDGVLRNTRYNGNYIFNVTGGKEFKWTKKGKQKILGVNARLAYLGGFRDSPIDAELSKQANTTIYVEEEVFTLKQKDYFKVDFRIYYKNNKPGFNSMVALDFQNLTNAENEAYSYYDIKQSQIVTKYQLGLIPNLSYRVEF